MNVDVLADSIEVLGVLIDVPFVFLSIWRTHDLGRAGWIPVAAYFLDTVFTSLFDSDYLFFMVVFALCSMKGPRGPNLYGPDPEAVPLRP
jgi:uncharacterized membrane protein YhaH (DUF805 family)